MIEFERVTTRGGDKGETSLFNGERRVKNDVLFEALGSVDELMSFLGVLRSVMKDTDKKRDIHTIQQVLFKIGAQLATPVHDPLYEQIKHVEEHDIEELEEKQAVLMKAVKLEDAFITPGDNRISAEADVCRSVCRRAERMVVSCIRSRGMPHIALCQNFLNRLSDYLFVFARYNEQN
jgi:cob(I)alamin adenosyltransferase